MITVRIQLDAKPVERQLSALERVQLPFATSLALNNLAKRAQENIRDHYRQAFTLRRPDFIEKQGAKIVHFATKREPFAELGIDPKADFLTKFEKGGTRRPRSGRSLTLPEQIQTNKFGVITSGKRPRRVIDTGRRKKGAGRVFILQQRRGSLDPGIYQTTQRKGRGPLKMLYALESQVQIPAILQFVQIAQRTAEQSWPTLFEAAMQQALRTAR